MTKDEAANRLKLNTALQDPHRFRQFQADPKAFAALHGIAIDRDASDAIKATAAKASSVQELATFGSKAMEGAAIAHLDTTVTALVNSYVGGFNAGQRQRPGD